MKKQDLTYYPLPTMQDVDDKIKEVGNYWKRLTNINIEYLGGAYMLKMTGTGVK